MERGWCAVEQRRRVFVVTLVLVGAAWCTERHACAQRIGADIAALNLCLYGDCEARGAYAADPYGFANPGTLAAGTLPLLPRGAFVSQSYFRLNVGGVGLDVTSPSITLAADPWVFEANVIYADGGGTARSLPGTDLRTYVRMVRLAAGVDLGRTTLGIKGLSVGLLAGVPGTTSDLHLTAGGFTLVDSHEDHELGLTPGIHWRAGERDWFNVGAFLQVERHHESAKAVEPFSQVPTVTYQHGTTNAWFSRVGLSVLPFVPLDLTTSPPLAEMLGEMRLAVDFEYRNISALGEPTAADEIGYFGLDARVLPDAWNPLSDYLRLYVITGVDTHTGWGIGAGLWGNGPLEFLSCNPAYSSRPLAPSLGDRVDVWAATCAVVVPW